MTSGGDFVNRNDGYVPPDRLVCGAVAKGSGLAWRAGRKYGVTPRFPARAREDLPKRPQ